MGTKSQPRKVGKGEQDCQCLLPKTMPSENLGGLNDKEQVDEYIDSGNKEIDVPFPILSAHFDPKDDVVDWDKGFPPG